MNALNNSERAEHSFPKMAFLRIGVVIKVTGLGRSTIYRLIAENSFPAPVRLAKRAVGWRIGDLEIWSATRARQAH